VLGVLIEKAKTTPAGYPMSANAIVAGCNQKNNREPSMTLDETDVSNTLVELQRLKVVSELDWLGRVPKYKHDAYAWFGVDKTELAVMTELLLRGAQALGDLRGRAARMEPIGDLAALKPVVDALMAKGLMIELTSPGRGQIVSHNLYTAAEGAELRARYSGQGGRDAAPAAAAWTRPVAATPVPDPAPPQATPEPTSRPASPDRINELSAEVASLKEVVASLRERLGHLERRLG
jgi:uncharacterized protein YceH (UPF0502 family)